MASYNADINLNIVGATRLNSVIASVGKLNRLAQDLKPINLIAPGAGELGNKIRLALKPVTDFARAIENGNKRISNTFQGASQQADVFRTVLQNVKVQAGGYEKQVASVKLYANALATAEKQARGLARAQNDLLRTAQGLQEQNIRDAEVISRRTRVSRGREIQARRRERASGAVSNALIGGAFPLLFGQGAGAAAGGALGGLVGGAFGGAGGFAGSLVGTLLGDIASRGQAIKNLAEDIGFSAEQTIKLADAFKVAGTDVEKFTAVIQNIRGIGLELEDQAKAIQLVTRLTEVYGGSFEKTGNAITSALESGKVTQGTLNQLTSQGINIQQALATKFGVNRDAILKMAKDGKISVQSLIDTLVDLGNAPGKAAQQTQTASQLFQSAIQNLTKVVGPELERLTGLFLNFGATALNALTNVLVRLGQVGTAIENKIAGSTLQNAQKLFKDDAQRLKGLYAVPKEARTPQQIRQITSLERLQQGRMQVIEAAKPKPVPKLQTFAAPSQAAPTGGARTGTGGAKKDDSAEKEARMQERLQGLSIETNEIQRQSEIRQQITKAEIEGDKQLIARLQGEERIKQVISGLQRDLIGVTDQRERQALVTQTAVELDAVQVQTAGELAKLDAERTKNIEDIVNDLDMELLTLQATTDVKKQALQFTEIENQLKQQGIVLTNQDAEAIRKKIAEIDKAKKAQEAVNAQVQMEKDLFTNIAGAFAGTLTSAFDAAVAGTENFGEALKSLTSDLLATIGKMLIVYGIAQALGALGGGAGNPQGVLSFLARAFGYKGAKDGAYWSGGFKAFANGGMVTSPTMGLIGEGGEPEYVIPASKMAGAMQRYSAGARGSNVIPDSSSSGGGMGAGGTNTYTLETVVINNVEYATVEQVREFSALAARQGAEGGYNRTMGTLRNSRSQRSRIGLR